MSRDVATRNVEEKHRVRRGRAGAVFLQTERRRGTTPQAAGVFGGDIRARTRSLPHAWVRFAVGHHVFHVPVVLLGVAVPQVGGAHLCSVSARLVLTCPESPAKGLSFMLGVVLGAPPPIFLGAVRWAPPSLNRSLEKGVFVLPDLAVHVALGPRP